MECEVSCYGTPEIFNSDQGAQFTSDAFAGVIKGSGINISMGGKGRWAGAVFVQRLRRIYSEARRYKGLKRKSPGQDHAATGRVIVACRLHFNS